MRAEGTKEEGRDGGWEERKEGRREEARSEELDNKVFPTLNLTELILMGFLVQAAKREMLISFSAVVSRIYAPCFATLALVESVGGAYMRDLTFYLTLFLCHT